MLLQTKILSLESKYLSNSKIELDYIANSIERFEYKITKSEYFYLLFFGGKTKNTKIILPLLTGQFLTDCGFSLFVICTKMIFYERISK